MESARVFNQIPLTLPMLKNVIERGEPFTIDEKPIEQIEIIGLGTSFQEVGSMIELTLSGDGEVFTVQTYRKDASTVAPPFTNYTFKENSYALVVGNINVFNRKVTINASIVQNVDGLGSLLFFKSKLLWSYLNRKKMIKKPEVVQKLDRKFTQEAPPTGNSGNSGTLSDSQKAVIEAIQTSSSGPEGAKYNDLLNKLRAKLSDDQLKKTIDQLIEYGFIFVSEDDSYIIA